jgi:hypothetical protein
MSECSCSLRTSDTELNSRIFTTIFSTLNAQKRSDTKLSKLCYIIEKHSTKSCPIYGLIYNEICCHSDLTKIEQIAKSIDIPESFKCDSDCTTPIDSTIIQLIREYYDSVIVAQEKENELSMYDYNDVLNALGENMNEWSHRSSDPYLDNNADYQVWYMKKIISIIIGINIEDISLSQIKNFSIETEKVFRTLLFTEISNLEHNMCSNMMCPVSRLIKNIREGNKLNYLYLNKYDELTQEFKNCISEDGSFKCENCTTPMTRINIKIILSNMNELIHIRKNLLDKLEKQFIELNLLFSHITEKYLYHMRIRDLDRLNTVIESLKKEGPIHGPVLIIKKIMY